MLYILKHKLDFYKETLEHSLTAFVAELNIDLFVFARLFGPSLDVKRREKDVWFKSNK